MKDEIKELVRTTTIETFHKELQKIKSKNELTEINYFKNTEKVLYNFMSLKEHVADQKGYFAMLNKHSAKSIVRYEKNKTHSNERELYLARAASLERSLSRVNQIEGILKSIQGRKEYRVLELTYFEKKKTGERYSLDEIVEILKEEGIQISSKTVTRWKKQLITELSVRLFGADAL